MKTKRRNAKRHFNRKQLLSEVGSIVQKKGFRADVKMEEGYFLLKVKDLSVVQKPLLLIFPRRCTFRTVAKVYLFPRKWVFHFFSDEDFHSVRRLANNLTLSFGVEKKLHKVNAR